MSEVILKAEKDFSKEVDVAIPEAEATAKVSAAYTDLFQGLY